MSCWYQRLADGGRRRPARAVREEVGDGDGQVVVGVQSPVGVTMPWRSASVSLPKATAKLSLRGSRFAIA